MKPYLLHRHLLKKLCLYNRKKEKRNPTLKSTRKAGNKMLYLKVSYRKARRDQHTLTAKDLVCGKSELLKHSQVTSHKNRAKSLSNQQTLKSMTTFQTNVILENNVKKAEI
jgi:hypothetical protein